MPQAPRTLRPPGARARDEARRGYDRERAERAPWRRWYKLAIWCGKNGIRARELAQHPLCQWCEAEGLTVPATEVHHKEPHRGVWRRFIGGPFECLCKPCHDSDAQSGERRG